jgi:hypothetical protein
MHSGISRNNLWKESKRWTLAGAVADDGEGTIFLGKVLLGSDDYVEHMTIVEIITHETIHHLVRRLKGQFASQGFDSMTLNRSYMDSYRRYVQKIKIHVIF